MKAPLVMVLLFCTLAMAEQPQSPPKAPVPTDKQKIEYLEAKLAQKQAQLDVMSDPKYVALLNAGSAFTAKYNAMCPAVGTQQFRYNDTTAVCEPAK